MFFKAGSNNYINTFSVARDLTNSPHEDQDDDTFTFGLWYPTREKARTWFLFPKASIAIECSARPVIVCWDGRRLEHCSCTVNKGMVGLAGIRKQKLSDYNSTMHRHLFEKKNYSELQVGTKVACIEEEEKDNKKRKLLAGTIISLNRRSKSARVRRSNKIIMEKPFYRLVRKA